MIQQGNESNMTVMKNLPLLEKKGEEGGGGGGGGGGGEEEEEEEYEVEGESTKKEDCSKNEVFSKTTKNVQKASSTPPSKRQLTVMETLQINKMKRDKEAGDKKKKENVAKTPLRLQQKSRNFCSR